MHNIEFGLFLYFLVFFSATFLFCFFCIVLRVHVLSPRELGSGTRWPLLALCGVPAGFSFFVPKTPPTFLADLAVASHKPGRSADVFCLRHNIYVALAQAYPSRSDS